MIICLFIHTHPLIIIHTVNDCSWLSFFHLSLLYSILNLGAWASNVNTTTSLVVNPSWSDATYSAIWRQWLPMEACRWAAGLKKHCLTTQVRKPFLSSSQLFPDFKDNIKSCSFVADDVEASWLNYGFSLLLSSKLANPLTHNMKSFSIIHTGWLPPALQETRALYAAWLKDHLNFYVDEKLITSQPSMWHPAKSNNGCVDAGFHVSAWAAAFIHRQSHRCMCCSPTTGHVFRHAIKRPHPQPCWIWKPYLSYTHLNWQ